MEMHSLADAFPFSFFMLFFFFIGIIFLFFSYSSTPPPTTLCLSCERAFPPLSVCSFFWLLWLLLLLLLDGGGGRNIIYDYDFTTENFQTILIHYPPHPLSAKRCLCILRSKPNGINLRWVYIHYTARRI